MENISNKVLCFYNGRSTIEKEKNSLPDREKGIRRKFIYSTPKWYSLREGNFLLYKWGDGFIRFFGFL